MALSSLSFVCAGCRAAILSFFRSSGRTPAEDAFAKMVGLSVGGFVTHFVQSCLVVDSGSKATSGLRVTVKRLGTPDGLLSNAERVCEEGSG
jgi:hypothetical protein